MRLPDTNVPEPRFWVVLLIEFLSFQGRLASAAKDRARRRFLVAAVTPGREAFVRDDLAEEVAALVQGATAGEATGA